MQNNTINPEFFEETGFAGMVLFKPRVFRDDRGFFCESYKKKLWQDNGFEVNFIQDNESFSPFGTLRGLHFQTGEHAQTKIVRVSVGRAQVLVVDLRSDEPTFGKHYTTILDDQQHHQLLVPKGFAHAFLALSDSCLYQYKVDNYWNKESEGGVAIFDPSLIGAWQLKPEEIIANDRDKNWPLIAQSRQIF